MDISKIGIGMQSASMSAAPKADVNLANAFQASQGVYRVSDKTIELFDTPTTNTITMYGRNSADNADANNTVYALNTVDLNKATGKAAAYDDGFAGLLIDKHLTVSNLGRGLLVKAITFIGLNAVGSQDATVLQQLNFNIVTYTVKGGTVVPKPIDLSSAIRNTQFQSGTLTLEFPNGLWLNTASQIKAYVVSGATVTATIEWAN